MPKRVCSKAHVYAGRPLVVGEEFDVEQRHVDLQLRLGRIEPEEGEYGYQTRDMTAADPAEYNTREMVGTLHVKRAYHRKDASK